MSKSKSPLLVTRFLASFGLWLIIRSKRFIERKKERKKKQNQNEKEKNKKKYLMNSKTNDLKNKTNKQSEKNIPGFNTHLGECRRPISGLLLR